MWCITRTICCAKFMRLVVEPYSACVASNCASTTHRLPSKCAILANLRTPSVHEDAGKTELIWVITCTQSSLNLLSIAAIITSMTGRKKSTSLGSMSGEVGAEDESVMYRSNWQFWRLAGTLRFHFTEITVIGISRSSHLIKVLARIWSNSVFAVQGGHRLGGDLHILAMPFRRSFNKNIDFLKKLKCAAT